MKKIPVYLSQSELKEIQSCINFKLNQDFDVSFKLIEKIEEELETFKEGYEIVFPDADAPNYEGDENG